jgi:hypothetical protein
MVMPGLALALAFFATSLQQAPSRPAAWRTKQCGAKDLQEHDLHEACLNNNWLGTHRHLSNE